MEEKWLSKAEVIEEVWEALERPKAITLIRAGFRLARRHFLIQTRSEKRYQMRYPQTMVRMTLQAIGTNPQGTVNRARKNVIICKARQLGGKLDA